MAEIDLETDSYADSLALFSFQLASWCTDPICKARENWVWYQVVDQRYPQASTISRFAEKIFTALRMAAWGVPGLFLAPLGICLRSLGTKITPHPFTHLTVKNRSGLEPSRNLSILSYNECNVDGGYCLTDGGVMPKEYRFKKNTQEILSQKTDVLGSYEIFDVNTAWERAKQLASYYKNFFINIGAQALGTSSALFFATVFDTHNPFFTPFPQHMLVERTKYAGKGLFSVEIGHNTSQFQKIATIFQTHLQHSEIPEKSQNRKAEDRARRQEEESARLAQMNLILTEMDKVEGPAILIGDLNLDEEELQASPWKDRFMRVYDPQLCSWGGDQACVELVNKIFRDQEKLKPASRPLNLDYILVLKKPGDTTTILSTEIAFKTHFNGRKLTTEGEPEALSDHEPLRATIQLSLEGIIEN